MLIGSPRRLVKLTIELVFRIEDVPLEEIQSYNNNNKLVGVAINKNLTWHDYIDYIKAKINKKLGLLRRIKNYLPLKCRLLFYNSYILPLFDYADLVWGDRGNETLMSDLQVLQNKAAKIILVFPYRSSAIDALKRLSWVILRSDGR